MYDYLIVGSGLYGAMFAYEAKKRGKSALLLIREIISAVISTAKISRVSMFINMVPIFSYK